MYIVDIRCNVCVKFEINDKKLHMKNDYEWRRYY